ELPSSYNGFLYPLEGGVLVEGTASQRLSVGQIGWLELGGPATNVRRTAGNDGARGMVYAGERQDGRIRARGRLVPESRPDVARGGGGVEGGAELARRAEEYVQGRMARVSELNRVGSNSET